MTRQNDPLSWNDDLLRDPHHVADKRSRVQKMFAAIAPKYDLNNRLHSFGMDQRWRKKAVKLAELKAGDRVVDVACGTGDLTVAFAQQLKLLTDGEFDRPPLYGQILGVDFTFDMLGGAQRKPSPITFRDENEDFFVVTDEDYERGGYRAAGIERNNAGKSKRAIVYLNADATALPLPDHSADVVSIAFGIRNVQEPAKALTEFFRVLKPGGRLIVLEFSQPKSRVIRFFNDLYCNRIMPTTATWISGDKSGAYKYLPMSVKTFMSRETMMQMMRDAGFADVTQHPMTFGVAVVYRGYKQ